MTYSVLRLDDAERIEAGGAGWCARSAARSA